MKFDVGVIGGGAIGLACAWRLAQGGARVALFESKECGAQSTHAAGGMLAAQSERAGHPLNGAEADSFFDACLASRAMYADFAQELQQESGIGIELSLAGSPSHDWREPGILFVADHELQDERERIAREFRRQKASGLDVERRAHEGTSTWDAFWLGSEGQVENRLLALSLRRACERAGVTIFENTPVERADEEWRVGGEALNCEQVLVCAGAWSGGLERGISHPLRGQMIVLDAGKSVASIHYGSRAYLIPRRDGRLLVGATQENTGFDARTTCEGAQVLVEAARDMLPHLENCEVIDHWAGLRPASPDGLPSIGRVNERMWCATGHGRNGILLCPWTAHSICGAMLEGAELPPAFDPNRLTSTPTLAEATR